MPCNRSIPALVGMYFRLSCSKELDEPYLIIAAFNVFFFLFPPSYITSLRVSQETAFTRVLMLSDRSKVHHVPIRLL